MKIKMKEDYQQLEKGKVYDLSPISANTVIATGKAEGVSKPAETKDIKTSATKKKAEK